LCLLSGMISNYPPKSKPNSALRMNYPNPLRWFWQGLCLTDQRPSSRNRIHQ
jgi:hypothetical protein